jgi:hypothetical protein
LLVLLGASLLLMVSFAQGPDLQLQFVRQVPSDTSPAKLDRYVSSVTRWPQWFFSLALATIADHKPLEKGAIITFNIDPHKGAHRRFVMTAEVENYSPGHTLELKILTDSSGRLTKLFDLVNWKIDFIPKSVEKPGEDGSYIRGTVTAHTHHWRARLFGRMAEKILMNQIFYPDLIKLSELTQPFSLEQTPQSAPGVLSF